MQKKTECHSSMSMFSMYFQAYNELFNKGLIMNIAFKYAMKQENFDCVIFHDVDMIPENDLNFYECGSHPRHLSPALDEMRYT